LIFIVSGIFQWPFDDAAEPYSPDVEISDEDVKFILEGEDELMYLLIIS
jgi:hypothetical protein